MSRRAARPTRSATSGTHREAGQMNCSPARYLEENAGRRQTEVTLVAALILLIVLVVSLARACPLLPNAASPSPVPQVLSSAELSAPDSPSSVPHTTDVVHPQDSKPSLTGA
jgi:hypothetical protein